MKRGIFLVLGMHRSGTSLVAGLLHQAGIVMGEDANFWPPASDENAKGFYENHRFRLINDALLRQQAYLVKGWNPSFKPTDSSNLKSSNLIQNHPTRPLQGLIWVWLMIKNWQLMRQMRSLINEYSSAYSHWGWKDPRQMLTCNEWYPVLYSLGLNSLLHIIYIFRDPLSVAISLQKRGSIETLSHGIAVWHLYNAQAIKFVDQFDFPKLFLSFEGTLNYPERTRDVLSAFLERDLDESLFQQFVSPNLVRSDFTTIDPDLSIGFDQKVFNLYSVLQERDALRLELSPN